ncbi:class I SAM-dependent methyltransferase [Adhaeribacter terreus]|uniref:Class I SAM-dependent methyltransferase n=1 Tax=Adhaeribacter terreus TaxID=529703 RepID=A0ABW0ECH9_9BACT
MAYERLENCPVCGKSEFKNFLVVKDKSVSQESFVIVQCENCSFKFTNPRPDAESIGAYYESEDYISHSNTNKGIINKAYQVVRSIAVKDKLELINKLAPKGAILDYGCGTGYVLAACQKDGWKVEGFEPNLTANKQAEEKLGKYIEKVSLERFDEESFEIITMWHVLEHVHTLNETFQELLSLLKPGGVMLVAVPNADSLDAQKYGENWAAYDVPRHLYHFNQATMKRFLKKHKLALEDTKPMKYDAYYVSMLSEKYKAGKTKMFNSVLNGYKSNSYASKNNKDYSSLIYIARKK